MSEKIVLAYSGGLDTSVIVPWLKETYPGCEVHAFVGDVGQGAAELDGIEDRALRSGAVSCHVADLREQLLTEFAFPVAAAGALYEGRYMLGTSLARPILARAQAEYALSIGADALAHGCTGKGNDQVRFETVFSAFAPGLRVIAPWREWTMTGRVELLEYLEARGLSCGASREKIYSRDRNLWHVSHEGGVLEDPWEAPPEDVWTWTVSPEDAPEVPASVLVGFEGGVPVTLDGRPLAPIEMMDALNALGAAHGIGRIDIVENRVVGMKSRGCYETPGGTLIGACVDALDDLVLDGAARKLKESMAIELARFVYDGRWYTPAREALSAAMAALTGRLTGEVELKLYKGSVAAVRRRSPGSLYSEALASFDDAALFDHADAAGFIRLFSLPSRVGGAGLAKGVPA